MSAPPRSLFKEYYRGGGGGGGGGGSVSQRGRRNDNDKQLQETTIQYLTEMEQDSSFFSNHTPRRMAHLEASEVEIATTIGMGEFGVVFEISAIHNNNNNNNYKNNNNSIPNTTQNDAPPLLEDCPIAINDHESSEEMLVLRRNCQSCGALSNMLWKTPPPPDTTTGTTGGSNESTTETLPSRSRPTSSIIESAYSCSSSLSLIPPTQEEQSEQAACKTHLAENSLLRRDDQHAGDQGRAGWKNTNNSSSRKRHPTLSRYAVKQLRKDLYPKKKAEAYKDLAREAKLLACLDHPNIIKLRAIVSQPGHVDFMLVFDRLSTTLAEQLHEWHRQEHSLKSSLSMSISLLFWQSQQQKQQQQDRTLLSERLIALCEVAQAMRYLHKKRILFRDLKPENVARNHHGAMQLLDFGLAKEVKPMDRIQRLVPPGSSSSNNNRDDEEATYKLTGLTGTVRIMAPEVLQCQPYGLSADVYSFGILSWEVFSGNNNQLTAAEIAKGQRPPLDASNNGMPQAIANWVQRCWSYQQQHSQQQPSQHRSQHRPTFESLCQALETQLLHVQGEQQMVAKNSDAPILSRFDYLTQLKSSLPSITSTTTSMEQ